MTQSFRGGPAAPSFPGFTMQRIGRSYVIETRARRVEWFFALAGARLLLVERAGEEEILMGFSLDIPATSGAVEEFLEHVLVPQLNQTVEARMPDDPMAAPTTPAPAVLGVADLLEARLADAVQWFIARNPDGSLVRRGFGYLPPLGPPTDTTDHPV